MRKALLIVLFCVTSFSAPRAFCDALLQPLFKGDLPAKEAQPAWAGFYSGLIAGGQFGQSSDKTADFGYNADNDEWNYNESGFNGGVEAGYSFPFNRFVAGPEIELGYLGMSGNGAQPSSPGLDTVGKTSSDFYTAFRARIGATVKNYLIFATGGVIGVNYTKQIVDSCNIAPCGGGTLDANKNNFIWGYTAGGGIEYMLKKNWSIKLEYLYFNLNNQSFSGNTNLGNTYDWTGQTSGNIIRGGVNYYF